MAAAAILLAPSSPLRRETDREWAQRFATWWEQAYLAWDRHTEGMEDEERRLARGCFSSPSLSGNGADAWKYRDDARLVSTARAWVEDGYPAWVAAGRPSPAPDITPADFERSTGEPSGMGVDSLVDYRGGYKTVPASKLPAGAAAAWLGNKAALDAFGPWSGRGDHELRVMLCEITRVHGGESLALWTYGHAVHAWHARTPEIGAPPTVTVASHRIDGRLGRAPSRLHVLRDAMREGALAPDWRALESLLAGERVSVRAWFQAFGIPGAEELVPTDHEAIWERFERVAAALLAATPADARDVKTLNEIIAPLDDAARLKARPLAKRGGRQARAIADAATVLAEAVGESGTERWRARRRAAGSYWDIADGPAGERLVTLGERARKRGRHTRAGQAADLGRLLVHYPEALARDAIFLALAAKEAEAANGHGFVVPLLVLSENAATAGFSLAVHPAAAGADFRATFGLAPRTGPAGESEAHVFVDLPEVTDGLPAALADWYARTKSDGVVLRAEPDGSWATTFWSAGEVVAPAEAPPDPVALAEAATALAPRRALAGLGLPDLLAPGEWQEGSYGGEGRATSTIASVRSQAEAAVASLPSQARSLGHPLELLDVVGAAIRGSPAEDRAASLRVEPEAADEALLNELRADLAGDGLADAAGATWTAGGAVFAFAWSGMDVALLANVIADLPTPIRLAIDSRSYAGRIVLTG